MFNEKACPHAGRSTLRSPSLPSNFINSSRKIVCIDSLDGCEHASSASEAPPMSALNYSNAVLFQMKLFEQFPQGFIYVNRHYSIHIHS